MEFVFILLGVLIGAGCVFYFAVLPSRVREAELRARLEDPEKLAGIFSTLSAESLRANNEAFLQLAHQSLARFHDSARTDLDGRQRAIGESLQPVREYLGRVEAKIGELEKARVAAYAQLTEQVRSLATSQVDLHKETANLAKALRTPHTRGRWGEVQLRRVVEMAGMVERCDFYEQHTLQSEGGRLRPDLLIRLPNGRSIVVDSKVPLSAYLEAIEARDDQSRAAKLREHAAQVRTHIRTLSQKGYWSQLDSSPEFAVAFLPGEPFFSAALEHDPELIEYGVGQNVVLATPTTLIALLKSVAYGWRQQEMTRNAQEISRLGAEIYDRLARFATSFAKTGADLGKAVESYNASVGTLESRILPSARKIKERGATAAAEIGEVQPVDKAVRGVHAAELLEGPQSPLT